MKGENMADLKPIIKESFVQYSGAVLQSRALVDVRDCLKPSARQIFYCLFTDSFLHSKPFKKTLKGIGSAMRLYIHGDSSCEGVIMRAGQPFAMRYPLIEVEGSYGNLMESGNWAAPRYTSSRLSALSEYLFADIKKNTISEWRDNYDDTEKYPAVLTGKGFYNIVNGSFGM
jgi:DNA gyrase subunit A